MCLSIPGKVIYIDNQMAKVDIGGTICDISIVLLDDIRIGDFVLVHAGFAIQKLNETEAIETLKLFAENEDIANQFKSQNNEIY